MIPTTEKLPDGRTIIEAKIGTEWRRIAAASNPIFLGDIMVLERMVIARRPQFTIRPIGIEKWMKDKILLVTTIRETPKSHQTTSWACTYRQATGVVELDDICALTGVTLQL